MDMQDDITTLKTQMNLVQENLYAIKGMLAEMRKGGSSAGWGVDTVQVEVEEEKKPQLDPREENLQRKVDDIMLNFDFEKVHDVMDHLDWRWLGDSTPPSKETLRRAARELLEGACSERTDISTGGFRAVYSEDGTDDDDPYLGLEFIVEDCEGFTSD